MGELFINVIENVGVESCVQITMDNAPVCKVAGMIVEAKYPHYLDFHIFSFELLVVVL